MNADERRYKSIKILIVLFISSFLFCSKANTPEGVAVRMVELAQDGAFEQLRQQCTPETAKAISALEDHVDLYDWRFVLKRKYAKDSDWRITRKEISEGVATIWMKCESHPVENTRGNESSIRLRKSGNQWQLDMAPELHKALKRAREYKKKFGAGDDLRKYIR